MTQITDVPPSVFQAAGSAMAALASSSHFLFKVSDQPKDAFKVIHWQGNEGISTSYRYTLSLAAGGVVDETKILGKDATLSIDWDGETRVIHGYVSRIIHLGTLVSDHAEEYEVVMESPLAKLDLNRQNRVFLNLDIKGVVEKVLLDACFAATAFRIDLKSTYPVREYTVQYNETDFNFLSRQLEHAGLFYNFVQQEEQALLVIQDDSAALPKMTGAGSLAYQPVTGQVEGSEAVQALQKGQFYLSQGVKRKDHNYRTPETTLLSETTSSSKIPASGTDYVYGERVATLEEGEQIARRRQEAIDWQRAVYAAETNCRGMTAGTTFSVNGHPQDDNNGDYLVVSVLHQGDQSNAFAFGASRTTAEATAKTYRNELTLIKKEIPYRTPVDLARRPPVHGVLTAKVETTGGDYAYLDDQGRYRVKSLFDIADTKAGEASHPVRMMQPNAGSNYGVHFPLHAGTEVLVACLNGDPDRPIILGSVSNPSSQSPVTSSNSSQHIVRTFAGNELLMDDLANSEKINLHTRDQKNFLSLDANSDGHLVKLRTEEGRAEFYAKKTMSFESGDSYTLLTGNDQTITVENRHSLQTNKKDIAFAAGADILLTAKDNIKLSAEDKDVSLSAGQDLIVETGKSMSVRVMDGDSTTTIDQGQLSIEAAMDITLLGQGGGSIQISQGGGTIQISSGGDLTIEAASVEISGASVNITGQQVSLDGGGGGGGSSSGGAVAAGAVAAVASKALASVASTPSAVANTALTPMLAASSPMGAPAAASTMADAPKAATTKKAEEEKEGRFITAAEGRKIADVAKKWEDTPYGVGKYAGGNPVKNAGADCSGSTWKIYEEAGFSYGGYQNSASFPTHVVGTDKNFIKGKHYFKKVSSPQVGDIGWWNGHMVIYDPKAGPTVANKKIDGDVWSASKPGGKDFGSARASFFTKQYGAVTWHRYWKAP